MNISILGAGNVGMALESIPFSFAQPVDSLPNFAVITH